MQIQRIAFKDALWSFGKDILSRTERSLLIFSFKLKQTINMWRTLPPLWLPTVFWELCFPLRTACLFNYGKSIFHFIITSLIFCVFVNSSPKLQIATSAVDCIHSCSRNLSAECAQCVQMFQGEDGANKTRTPSCLPLYLVLMLC